MPAANDFTASTSPKREVATDTLMAAQLIARNSRGFQPELRLRVASKRSIRCRQARPMRAVPYMPYLSFAPSAWVLPLKFDWRRVPLLAARTMFDSEANLWVGNNFTIGWQGRDALWQGNASKFNPNGEAALSDHNRLCRRRDAGGHLRCGGRKSHKDNVLGSNMLRRAVNRGIRQERQTIDSAGGYYFRWQARSHARHHRRAWKWRCVGTGGIERTQLLFFPGGDIHEGSHRLRRPGDVGAVQIVPGVPSTLPSTSRTASG